MKIEDKIKELIIDALTKSQGMNIDEINEAGLELSRNKNNRLLTRPSKNEYVRAKSLKSMRG